eukprot:421626-Rhodomonas_salina.1
MTYDTETLARPRYRHIKDTLSDMQDGMPTGADERVCEQIIVRPAPPEIATLKTGLREERRITIHNGIKVACVSRKATPVEAAGVVVALEAGHDA